MAPFILASLVYIVSLLIVLWTTGAIYFDVGGGFPLGAILAVACVGLVAAAFLFWQPVWKPFVLLLVVFALFMHWWFRQQPSQHRNWDPFFARLSEVTLSGDQLTIKNVRNSEYRSPGEGTPRYETREYQLSQLSGVDVIVVTWGSPWMCHPMIVFDFGPDGRLCMSIEVRYRVGQEYSLFRSLYRQQELMYVVCDEQDAILRRLKYTAGHDLYLYRFDVGPLTSRQFFLEYANSINALAGAPRWYHGLTTNCTTSIYAQGRGRLMWDWRMMFNGNLDRLMYDRGLLDQRLPFDQLRATSWINDIAVRAPAAGFGDFLRGELGGYRRAGDDREEQHASEAEQAKLAL